MLLSGHQHRTAVHILRLGLAILSGFILAHPAAAEEARGARQTLIAVFPSHFPPIFDTTKNDVPTGFGIEVMEEIAARAGLRVRYRSLPAWQDVHTALQTGQADLAPNMGITPDRQQKFDFSRPLMRMSVSLYVRAGLPEIDNLQDLSNQNRSIAIVGTNVSADLIEKYVGVQQKKIRFRQRGAARPANR